MTLALAVAHRIPKADLQRVTSGFITNADGTEVALIPFIKSTKPMAKRLATILDAKVAEVAAAQAKKAAARAKKSATPSTAVE
jgi:hypothetical protein